MDFAFVIGESRHQKMAGAEGLEPTAPGFGDRCSTVELRSCKLCVGNQVTGMRRNGKPCWAAADSLDCTQQKTGAGDGNRTHTASLEGWDSTIELHPLMGTRIGRAFFGCNSKNEREIGKKKGKTGVLPCRLWKQ